MVESEREGALAAAVRDGRLVKASLPRWRRNWDLNPEGTARVLATLTAVPEVVAGGTPAAPDWTTAGEAGSPAASGAAGRGSGVQSNGLGVAPPGREFHGHPVASSGGRDHVFVEDGWITVDAFNGAGMTPDDLAYAAYTARAFPTGPVANRYHAGPK